MHPSMAKLPDQRSATIAFAQVQTAVDFLVRRVKRTGLRRLLALIRSNGGGVWKALTMVSSLPKERFTAEWKRYLRTLNLRLLSGYKQPEFKLSKAPSKEQRRQGLRQKKARDYLRLADLLRSRRRTRAAIVEYKKARELLGLREEFVANHLARAYLEISSPVQAIAALMPVLEYYPELPGPQVTMGLAYLRKGGDMGAAVRHLKAGLRLNPFNPEVHCGLAQALEEIDSQQAALHVKICKQLSRQ